MLIEKLKARFGQAIVATETAHGQECVTLDREQAPAAFLALRDEPEFAFNFLTDLTAVDWPERKPRFEVVYHLFSLSNRQRLRVKIGIHAHDAWVHSAYGIWKSADWTERECYDMFGIDFKGHPDLRRILLYDSFVGHPLRKDYPYNRRQPVVEEVDSIAHPRNPSR